MREPTLLHGGDKHGFGALLLVENISFPSIRFVMATVNEKVQLTMYMSDGPSPKKKQNENTLPSYAFSVF